MAKFRKLPHYIEPCKEVRIPRRIIVFDTESCQERDQDDERFIAHTLRIGCAVLVRTNDKGDYEERTAVFRSPAAFASMVSNFTDGREVTWIFAHNIGFDLTLAGFWGMVSRGFGKITSYCISDPPTVIHWQNGRKRATFVDTLNYWRMPLADIGRAMGVCKWDRPDMLARDTDWQDYCWQDVEILKRAVLSLIKFTSENGLGSFATTVSGLAWNAYRTRFMQHRIKVHSNSEATSLERAGYFGGETESYYVGRVKSPVHVLDANSLYPYVMREFPYPIRLNRVVLSPNLACVKSMVRDQSLIAAVRILSRGATYPVKTANCVLQCEGEFDTVLCGNQLWRAIDNGDVKSIGQVAIYDHDYIFNDFVDWFYVQKVQCQLSGDVSGCFVAKSILNHLAGKFGQRSAQWVADPGELADMQFGTWKRVKRTPPDSYICRAVCGNVQRLQSQGEWYDAFPAISAIITANGREVMRGCREICGHNEVRYQDTDSLHVGTAGRIRLESAGRIHQTRLGGLREEYVASNAVYRGFKDYTHGERRIIAGVKARAAEVADGCYMQDQFEGLRRILSTPPDGVIRSREIQIDRHAKYCRRVVTPDGWTVPIRLNYYPVDMLSLIQLGTSYISSKGIRERALTYARTDLWSDRGTDAALSDALPVLTKLTSAAQQL